LEIPSFRVGIRASASKMSKLDEVRHFCAMSKRNSIGPKSPFLKKEKKENWYKITINFLIKPNYPN
jgi:hypothetical protein